MHFELPIAAFISATLSLAPLPWHWRAGTVPTISLSLWLFASNIIMGINSIIWAGNSRLVAQVWCDIATKIIMGANVALPAAVFCLCVHLERVSSVRQVSTGFDQKRRRQVVDTCICFGVPMIYMALHYVVQGHRFDIVEDFGCRASIFNSIASIFLVWVPPLFFSLGACLFAGLALRNFWVRRITFARHLESSNSALTPSRYFRLMAMSLVQMFWSIAITTFNMWFSMKNGLRTWISWDDVHSNFSRVGIFPALLIPKQVLLFTHLLWWAVPISTILFFVFFAFGQEAIKEYAACFHWLKLITRLGKPRSEKEKVTPLSNAPSKKLKMLSILSSKSKSSDTKSENTLVSPLPLYSSYKWGPPASATSSAALSTSPSSSHFMTSPYSKSRDLESDTLSIITDSTHRY